MLLSAVSVLVVAQSSSEVPEGLMNNPVNCIIISILGDHRRICGPPLTETSLCGTHLYVMQQSLPKQSLHNFERFPAVYQGEIFRRLVNINVPPLVLFILISSSHNLHLFEIHVSVFLPSSSIYSGQVLACIFDLSYLQCAPPMHLP